MKFLFTKFLLINFFFNFVKNSIFLCTFERCLFDVMTNLK